MEERLNKIRNLYFYLIYFNEIGHIFILNQIIINNKINKYQYYK